jgi:2-polyprenyl-3-methyl-5-hydroxy-6-metoxy-1,4-benzoquinol methylase
MPMLPEIFQQLQQSTYDFRATASPDDPDQVHFLQWVNALRRKQAIAQVLQPRTILELGFGYGYSARAMLEVLPQTRYCGIDAGNGDAWHWATKILQPYPVNLQSGQPGQALPAGQYDLIHLNGTWANGDFAMAIACLKLALPQARYILVDGYYTSREHQYNFDDFLYQYRDLIVGHTIIAGDNGNLLIQVNPTELPTVQSTAPNPAGSMALRETYTSEYYTEDCGGYDVYAQTGGKNLADPRLKSVATIAGLKAAGLKAAGLKAAGRKTAGRVLDLGCGRGELAYYFAQNNYQVSAIDYSSNAIQLAQQCFVGEPELAKRVDFYCDSVCDIELPESHQQYDLAIASDLIEHLAVPEVDQLYAKVNQWLKPDGLFIIHTFPNLWYYRYGYQRRRHAATQLGAWLPVEPRSRYEQLMHINEQSPRVLKRQLQAQFQHVYLWFGDVLQPGGSLVTPYPIRQLREASSLYAIASNRPLDIEQLKQRLSSRPLPLASHHVKLQVEPVSIRLAPNQTVQLPIQLTNLSPWVINSNLPYPVNLSYHWYDAETGAMVVYEGLRTPVLPTLAGTTRSVIPYLAQAPSGFYNLNVQAPAQCGRYLLQITLVQEQVQWFDAMISATIDCQVS